MTRFHVQGGEGPVGKHIGCAVREKQSINEKIISHTCTVDQTSLLGERKK